MFFWRSHLAKKYIFFSIFYFHHTLGSINITWLLKFSLVYFFIQIKSKQVMCHIWSTLIQSLKKEVTEGCFHLDYTWIVLIFLESTDKTRPQLPSSEERQEVSMRSRRQSYETKNVHGRYSMSIEKVLISYIPKITIHSCLKIWTYACQS